MDAERRGPSPTTLVIKLLLSTSLPASTALTTNTLTLLSGFSATLLSFAALRTLLTTGALVTLSILSATTPVCLSLVFVVVFPSCHELLLAFY